ncbi:hypothetical protein [Streptomyces sp. NPDC058572]
MSPRRGARPRPRLALSGLRKEEYDPDTGELLGNGYDDRPAVVSVTS